MYARHDLVWLSDQGWRHALDRAPDGSHEIFGMWRRADWPAIVRRADADLLPDQVSLGIALPPARVDGAKARLGLRVPLADIRKVLSPLRLEAVIATAPQPWRAALATLRTEAASQGLSLGVYGSVALQALTGQAYVSARSDLDLLIHPTSRKQLINGLDLLVAHAARLPIDGEIVFPSGQAVAWKELLGALHAAHRLRVLVKEKHGVALSTVAALLATLEDEACMS